MDETGKNMKSDSLFYLCFKKSSKFYIVLEWLLASNLPSKGGLINTILTCFGVLKWERTCMFYQRVTQVSTVGLAIYMIFLNYDLD